MCTVYKPYQYGWTSDLPPDLQPEQLCFREVGAGGMYGPNAWRVAEMDKLGVYRACVNTRERMPNTDLFGTPYRGGSGTDMLRFHTDCWNEFLTSDSGFQRNRGCNKILAEVDYNRWDCVDPTHTNNSRVRTTFSHTHAHRHIVFSISHVTD